MFRRAPKRRAPKRRESSYENVEGRSIKKYSGNDIAWLVKEERCGSKSCEVARTRSNSLELVCDGKTIKSLWITMFGRSRANFYAKSGFDEKNVTYGTYETHETHERHESAWDAWPRIPVMLADKGLQKNWIPRPLFAFLSVSISDIRGQKFLICKPMETFRYQSHGSVG